MPIRFYEDAIKDTLSRFILTLWNSYSFFVTYAILDKFDPKEQILDYKKRKPLDKWILSRYNNLLKETKKYMEKFEMHKVARAIEDFIVEDLSNWYIRRSRKRLWVEEQTPDKQSAYSTMYEVFLNISKSLAPFIPFITEEIYQSLKSDDMPESIHLCDYPVVDEKYIDEKLEEGMEKIIKLAEEGRTLRAKHNIKIRYPLSRAILVTSKENQLMLKDIIDLLKEEINVKEIQFSERISEFVTKKAMPNTSKIGPKYKDKTNQVVEAIKKINQNKLIEKLEECGKVTIKVDGEEVELSKEDFNIVEETKENLARADVEDIILLLDITMTSELQAEGFAREIVRRIQSMRKEMNLDIEDKIETYIRLDKSLIRELERWIEYIKGETRSREIVFADKSQGKLVKKWDIDGIEVTIGISKQ
jgi:isoleucyl-tRNA synthetase